jgi:nitroreductase
LSPSSFGFEPWKFLVVQNKELRTKLLAPTWGAQGSLPTASHFLVILARKQKSMHYNSEYIEHMMKNIHHIASDAALKRKEFYTHFQKDDFNLLESKRATFDWACKQTYIALANMMSSAAMLGIDSCPIEGFNAKELEVIMQKDFGIDTEEFGVSVMLALGYRVDEQKRKTRQTLETITTLYK